MSRRRHTEQQFRDAVAEPNGCGTPGDAWDDRLENLRLLCPNCHALTPTYRGGNIGRYGSPVATPRSGTARSANGDRPGTSSPRAPGQTRVGEVLQPRLL